MFEELTPQVTMIWMMLITVTASILTFLLSALLLWKYRRSVTLAMTSTGSFDARTSVGLADESLQSIGQKTDEKGIRSYVNDLYRQAIRAPWFNAIRFSVSGLAFALVFAMAAQSVYPSGLAFPGFLIAVWIYTWPILLALPLIVPGSMRLWVTFIGAYFLVFLRVFSLGRRSDGLLEAVARYWRHLGSVQMITGPDVARSTVQPHQFLDFLSGKLTRHFVNDQASLTRSLAERDRSPDPDNRFRINNFFCHDDSWQPALLELVKVGDIVLMDLRSFSAANAGCIHELRLLVREVPLGRCLLVVDRTTDEAFLERTIQEAWEALPPDASNRGRSPGDMTIYRFEPGTVVLRGLVRRLCEAAGG